MVLAREYYPPDFIDANLIKLRQARKKGLDSYLHNAGLSLDDLVGKDVLDVGAGAFAYFGDGIRQLEESGLKLNCKVVSVDAGKFSNPKDIAQGANKKLGETEFENLKLKKKFDYIFSNFSTPYSFYNTNQSGAGEWLDAEDGKNLDKKIGAILKSAMAHLKSGGKAVFYPIYEGEVDFGKGGKRNFGDLKNIIAKELDRFNKKVSYSFEPVQSVTPGLPPAERLVIIPTGRL
ncbi:MAG: hypothetical protein WC526_03545 [Patescibacteria group bacterium]